MNKQVASGKALASLYRAACADFSSRPVDFGEQSLTLDGYFVTGICGDSRQLQKGDLFIATSGHQYSGEDFIDSAIKKGAAAVFVDIQSDEGSVTALKVSPRNRLVGSIPVLAIVDLAERKSAIAAEFYDCPSRDLSVTGVTGTNGKTSTAFFIAGIRAQLKQKNGMIGTLGYGVIDKNLPSDPSALNQTGLTTPDAITLQACFAQFVSASCRSAVMEVSSHALVQYRAEAVEFDVAVLTNFSRDHLDFHKDLDSYAKAKARLFDFHTLKAAVIHSDDELGSKLLSDLPSHIKTLSYSLVDNKADIYVKNITYSLSGMTADIVTPFGCGVVNAQLIGDFNLTNLLAAIGVILLDGHELDDVLASVTRLTPVPGRMQIVSLLAQDNKAMLTIAPKLSEANILRVENVAVSNIQVVVDYAHTEDALKRVLLALRTHVSARIWCVFGCGGDRDRGKRSTMGRAAHELADCVVVTSDNPRSEVPEQIIDDILLGIDDLQSVYVIEDRQAAIEFAITNATVGDLVLLAGKGHEQFQIVGEQHLPFSDVEVAQQVLKARAAS